jgi:hypothetical protein
VSSLADPRARRERGTRPAAASEAVARGLDWWRRLSARPFKDADNAVAQGNETFYGLAAAVWTRDVGKALRMARSLRAGTVWVNAYNLYDTALPLGGFKESGFGRELGQAGLDLYTEVKSVGVDLVADSTERRLRRAGGWSSRSRRRRRGEGAQPDARPRT